MPNKDGIQYYATAVDDYTGIVMLSLLRTKDEVKEKLIQNVTLLECHLNHKVRFIRTDGGKEYLDSVWTFFLHQSGIVHQLTTPHSP